MRFTLDITTRYMDRHPTASMTNKCPTMPSWGKLSILHFLSFS
jgi:hypothetical protein